MNTNLLKKLLMVSLVFVAASSSLVHAMDGAAAAEAEDSSSARKKSRKSRFERLSDDEPMPRTIPGAAAGAAADAGAAVARAEIDGEGGDEDGFVTEANFRPPPLSAPVRVSGSENKNLLGDALADPMACIFLNAVKFGEMSTVQAWVDSRIKPFFISHALHVAVRAYNVEMVCYLLAKGAQKEMLDVNDKTSLQLAQELLDKETQDQKRQKLQVIIKLLRY